ncbi:AIR synthase related protein domain protein [Methanocaldococcus villosus KIN24-T80]|uniref:AIR synthase related protein domain protein n=1 Tax=Methanocaldococcus villosus KIN24-T80 TaxID=1069083 RepID=N6VTI5_9EURY|nr:AIR synthase related protein [Methanocaldococcus villosus]ENN96491.1 AIR synthase related protein domain protein [Methanocaldococcus villosus KIN24-T80]
MDIEGYVRRCLRKNIPEEKIIEDGFKRIVEIKEDEEFAKKLIKAVLEEVKISEKALNVEDKNLKIILNYPKANVKMGEFGVGSRGEGDFFVHREIARIIESTNTVSYTSAKDQDDAGIVKVDKAKYIVAAVDGTHSRLSEFPFLAGFHVARAALRDVYVKGARGIALLSDIHLADDGDIGKIFDFTAGVCCVSEALNIPLIGGSTLRVGGDMVIGDRMVSSVTAIGVIDDYEPTVRKRAKEGDVILMTKGSGGGTITTTAIFYGYYDVIYETLNVDFIKACEKLIETGLIKEIDAMTDVTNGGVRGDAYEISKSSNVSLVFYKDRLYNTINEKVLNMLLELDIDPLGVSTDSLMVICNEDIADEVKKLINAIEVGYVEKGNESYIIEDNKKKPLKPMFRESAYTPVKKVVGEKKPKNFEKMKEMIRSACDEAIKKKDYVLELIRKRG